MGVALREFIHRVGWGRQVRGNETFRSLTAETAAGVTPGLLADSDNAPHIRPQSFCTRA